MKPINTYTTSQLKFLRDNPSLIDVSDKKQVLSAIHEELKCRGELLAEQPLNNTFSKLDTVVAKLSSY